MRIAKSHRVLLAALFMALLLPEPSHAQDKYIYWVDEADHAIWRGLADGSAAEAVLVPRLPEALDVANDTLYWVDLAAKAILREVEGPQPDTLVTNLNVSSAPAAIKIDPVGRKMYWFSGGGFEADRSIFRSDMDGTEVEMIIAGPITFVDGLLALDVEAGRLYWVEQVAEGTGQKMLCANLDGTGIETLVTGLSNVQALAVGGDKIYWADNATAMLQRANLDGTSVETVLADTYLFSIALDPAAGKLYFDAAGGLQRANLDGTAVETILLEVPQGGSLRPDVSNLTLNHRTGELYWISGSYPNQILRVGLDGSGLEEVVAGFGLPNSVAIDPARETMYWTGRSGEILRAHLDGTGAETLLNGNCGTGSVTDIELDLMQDVMYWGLTSDCGRGVGRAHLDGTEDEFVPIRGHEFADFIALIPRINLAFFSDRQGFKGVARINFDGTDPTLVVDTPACGIALDPEREQLYWADCTNGSIRRANLDGSAAEDILTGLAAPYDIELDLESDYLYWSERGSGKIRRATRAGTEVEDVFVNLSAPGRLALSFGQDTFVSRDAAEDVPIHYQLKQNYPNPFNPATTIAFTLPQTVDVRLVVYDLLGREVAVLAEGTRSAGRHTATFETSTLPSGVYLYQLEAGSYMQTQRMVLLK